MARILARDLKDHIGSPVSISGWLHKKRLLGGLTFINVRDRSGLTQVLIEDKDEVEKLRGMQLGTVLSVTGNVVAEERAPGGAEIHEGVVEVLTPVTYESPIEIDKAISHQAEHLDTLFEHRVVSLRNIREQAVFRIQAAVKEAVRTYLRSQEFVEFNSPKLLPGSTEGGAEVFKLDYFGKEATLAQSAQFYKQMMVGVFERAYEINPTYRAELSATTRHMTEFIHIDAEMGFVNFDELLNLLGELLHTVVESVYQSEAASLALWKSVKPLVPVKVPRLKLEDIHTMYEKATKQTVTDFKDLTPSEEKWVCEYAKKELGSDAVLVTHWPASEMKFYHRLDATDSRYTERADLLFCGVEIATGSMREHRYDVLVDQLVKKTGADITHPGFHYYLQAFKHGMPVHGGFGMGLERLTQKIISLANVKEASLFPRDINRLAP